MTIGAITSAVSTAVYNAFGDGYEIYTDRVTQGLHEPCFLVSCLSGTRGVDLGRRYARTAQFSVQYFPKAEGDCAEIADALERLLEALDTIEADGCLLHGTGLSGTPHDGMLTVTAIYDGFVLREEALPDMDSLTTQTNAKE